MTDTPTRPIEYTHRYWWVEFKNGISLFLYAEGKDRAWQGAEALVAQDSHLGGVEDVRTLPEPTGDWSPDGRPGFCYQPERCAGRVTCPRADSCATHGG